MNGKHAPGQQGRRIHVSASNAVILPLLFAIVFVITTVSADAARYRLERNWQTLRYGEVLVHFPEGWENTARFTAIRARSSIDSLEKWFGVNLGTVSIVLTPDNDDNFSFTTILPLRIELPVNPALEKGIRPENGLFLERVLMHELTHAVQFSAASGLMGNLRSVFGEVIAPAGLQPDWALEGTAVYTESLSGGGRLNSSYFRMRWRTPQLKGNTWSLDRMAVAGRVQPPADRSYIGGGLLCQWLDMKYDRKHVLKDWLHSQSAWPALPGVAFRKAFNDQTDANAYLQFKTHTEWSIKVFARDRMKRGLGNGQPLIRAPRTSWRSPRWLDDRSVIAVSRSYDTPPQLSRFDLKAPMLEDRGAALGAVGTNRITTFRGGVIASELRSTGWAPRQRTSTLVWITSSGARLPVGDPPLRGWSPDWSDEAGRLAYITPSAKGGIALVTVPLDGFGQPSSLPDTVAFTAFGNFADPAWSKNGRLLAFTADPGDGERVVLRESKSKTFYELSISGAYCTWDPVFSPNGNLWVSADPEGVFDLFEVDILKETAFRRTRVLSGAIEPDLSPDSDLVVYAHYTTEGFIPAVLDQDNRLAEPIAFELKRVDAEKYNDDFSEPELAAGMVEKYQSWRYLAPRFWVPAVGGSEEIGVGAATFGRDPLGLLEWRLNALIGTESGTPDVSLSLITRSTPVDISAFISTYPEKATRVIPVDTTNQAIRVRYESRFLRRWEGGLTLSQPFNLDAGKWRRQLFPYVGYLHRERYVQDRLDSDLLLRHYNGIRGGLEFIRYRGAPRDPVPSRLIRANVTTERSLLALSDLEGDLFQLSTRFHFPLLKNGVVLALTGSAQTQSGGLIYSRSSIRPRGYSDNDLPAGLRGGKIARGGVELHFPLFFPDRGILQGVLFIERLTGTVFAEGATGWGGGRDVSDWMEKDGCGSFGAEIGSGSYVFFDAALNVAVGAAWRTETQDWAFYARLGLPSIPGLNALRGAESRREPLGIAP